MALISLWLRPIALGLLLGALAIISSDVFARIYVSHEPMSIAISQAVHSIIVQPIGALFLLSPFACTACAAAAFSKNGRIMRGYCILAFGILLLSMLYVWGYCGSQRALQEHAWTAAALSVGLLPFLSVPVIAVSILFGLLTSSLVSSLQGGAKVKPP